FIYERKIVENDVPAGIRGRKTDTRIALPRQTLQIIPAESGEKSSRRGSGASRRLSSLFRPPAVRIVLNDFAAGQPMESGRDLGPVEPQFSCDLLGPQSRFLGQQILNS